ncbi:unnamed protein product [Larinioides sclopetarius]|uniref:Sushi domain-containing protein n=1 Tax=Larinioides sclopetarius TaxID=280406 RepID=A0AAV2B0U5_9ARAC
MLDKYSMYFPVPLVAVCIILMQQSYCEAASCPPPDFPEGGKYVPELAQYEVGMQIRYYCTHGYVMFFKRNAWFPAPILVTCQLNGEWSERSPVCDILTKLRYLEPPSEAESRELILFDRNMNTCFEPQNDSEEILQFSLDGEFSPFAASICFTKGRGIIKVIFSPTKNITYDTSTANVTCIYYYVDDYQSKTKNITIEVSSETNSSLSLCEMSVFTKDDNWCMHPLQTNSIPNGQLEVSHIKAVLHCKEGFKEKDGREVYATCENNTWSYLSLECVEDKSEMDHKILACPPPDFPEGGRYEPEKVKYEVGQKITYSCTNSGLFFADGKILINSHIESACELNGKWSQTTPFCDPPTKLNNPIAAVARGVVDYGVIDGDVNTCYYLNASQMVMAFSLDYTMLVYLGTICFRDGRATVKMTMHGNKEYKYNLESVDKSITTCKPRFFHGKTDFIVVEVSSNPSSIRLCEFTIYALDDKWCEVPPEAVSNGQLEVGRSKAVLHCNKGFREKEGREVYATCENKTWSYLSLQCTDTEDTPQKYYNTPGIVAGIVIGSLILILFGLAILLIRTKKIRGICALHKPDNRNSNSTLPVPVGCNSTDLSRPENTTV